MDYISFIIRVTKKEAETLYRASRGEILCPKCSQPMTASLDYCLRDKEAYFHSGMLLECPQDTKGCGYIEI